MRMLLVILLFVIMPFSAFSANADISVYRPSSQIVMFKGTELELLGQRFVTNAYADANGTETVQNSDLAYSKTDIDINARYGVAKKLECIFGSRYRQNVSTTNNESITKAGPESLWLGVKFSPLSEKRKFSFALDFLYRKTLYTNEIYNEGETPPSDEIILGDDGSEISAGVHFALPFRSNNFFAGSLAVRRPPNNLSPELPWNIELAWAYVHWAFVAGVRGIYSLGLDEYSDNPTKKPSMATGNTALFNSVNRSYTSPYLGINYASSNWKFSVEGSRVMSGVSTDLGDEYKASVTWLFGGVSRKLEKIEKFKEYEVEATVIKVSPRGKFIKIDQGVSGDFKEGMRIDIFQTDYFGGNELIASGVVYQIGASWAIVKIVGHYQEKQIKPGFVARGYEAGEDAD